MAEMSSKRPLCCSSIGTQKCLLHWQYKKQKKHCVHCMYCVNLVVVSIQRSDLNEKLELAGRKRRHIFLFLMFYNKIIVLHFPFRH